MNLEQSAKELREKLQLAEHIEKSGGKYELVSRSGKNLGKYDTKAGAEKREKQVEYFKHAKEGDKDEERSAIIKHEIDKGHKPDQAAAIAYSEVGEEDEDHYSKLGRLVEKACMA